MNDVVHNKESAAIPTVSVFGISVCKWGMADTLKYLSQAIAAQSVNHVITANPIMMMAAIDNSDYKQMMQTAELIVPDGTGLVWAAQKGGDPVAERVAGFDLLHELMRVGQQNKWKVYLLGSAPEVVEEAAQRLKVQYPGTEIVGYRDGYFGVAEDDEVIRQVVEAQPDILFVARGADTQEPWIAKYKNKLGVPVIMGVGGSFDVISGRTKRAPKLFQNLRLEWLYRLLKEPTRFRRMLALPKFAIRVMREGENLTKMG